jgi:trimethylamine--corrinoid protein Co-methyltransferase
MNSPARLLAPDQVERVHQASLEILAAVGLRVRSHTARTLLARHGCRVDAATCLVTFPQPVVERWRQACPATFTFHGLDPQTDRTIPDDGPLVSISGGAPTAVDPATGQARPACLQDIAQAARLMEELPGYDLCTVPVIAHDAPAGQFQIAHYYPALRHCRKPVRGTQPDTADAEQVLHLGALIAGSEAAYRARPFLTYVCCPVISPLTLDVDSTDMLIRCAREELPLFACVAPNAGVTAPLSLMGTLVQCNAEFLAVAVLTQMARPGTPLIYYALPSVADMRSLVYAPGAIETGILLMGCIQMARMYNVPCGGLAGLTNAKVNDAQSGFETGMSALALALSGANLLVIGGFLDAIMTYDPVKLVIDHEIGLMLKRAQQGLDGDGEAEALGEIADVGPGGTFVDRPHTLARLRTAALLPEIADRAPRHQWAAAGATTAHDRALQRVKEILERDSPMTLAPEVDARIRAAFGGLFAGPASGD